MPLPNWPVERIETEKRRLVMLRRLAGEPGYEIAASILGHHCRRVGVPSTSDQIAAAAAWLAEQGCVTLRHEDSEDQETVLRLTRAGREVAEGARVLPGVLRPDP